MPLYEYRCSKCQKVFEVLQKFAEAPLTVHEECGGQVERLISAPAFHLKGTGWYATDYKKNSESAPKGKGDSKGDSKTDGDSGSESKSDAKSDSKADSKSENKSESKTAASETTSSTPAPSKPD